ncbi:hypothetical protein HAX54_004733, partial [Datura stramonium]|nr:hypothetical protein [Datura stramonium]
LLLFTEHGGGEKRKVRGEGWFPVQDEWRREKSGGGFRLGGNGEEKISGGEVVLWWFSGEGDGRDCEERRKGRRRWDGFLVVMAFSAQ